jgi:hypothetical protein
VSGLLCSSEGSSAARSNRKRDPLMATIKKKTTMVAIRIYRK